jgi:hypothetical protein
MIGSCNQRRTGKGRRERMNEKRIFTPTRGPKLLNVVKSLQNDRSVMRGDTGEACK